MGPSKPEGGIIFGRFVTFLTEMAVDIHSLRRLYGKLFENCQSFVQFRFSINGFFQSSTEDTREFYPNIKTA